MKPPLVSVVIPTFNAEGTVREALASVWAQTFSDYEIIIVDDASTDETIAVARAELTNPRIGESPNHRIIALSQNRGPAAARNTGVKAARGDWIAFLDGDDAWLPWRLEVQLRTVRDAQGVGLVCGRTTDLDDEVDAPAAGKVASRELTLGDFAVRNEVATSTVLARKEHVVQAGLFDEQFRGPEDYDLWIRIAARTGVLKLETPLVRYRDVPGSLSRDDRTFLPQVLRVLEKSYGPGGALEHVPAKRCAQAYQYLCAAWMAAERGARSRACRLFLTSLACWPFTFKPYLNAPWCRTKLLAGILRMSDRSET